MKLFVLIPLLSIFWGDAVSAGPDRLSLLLGSRHVGGGDFNEVNPGVWLTWENPKVEYSVGVFRNSYGRGSVGATVALPVAKWRDGGLSLFAGLAHYPGDGRRQRLHLGGDVIPLGGLQVRHKNFFAQFIPSDGQPVDAIVSFGVTFSLSD